MSRGGRDAYRGVYVEGFAELDVALAKFIPKLSKKAIRHGSREAAKIVAADARSRAPVGDYDEGGYFWKKREPGQLKKNITVRAMRRSRTTQGHAVTVGKTLFVGDQFYGGFVEMGWTLTGRRRAGRPQIRYIPPQPFLRPALYDNQHLVVSTFVLETKKKLASIADECRRESGGDRIK